MSSISPQQQEKIRFLLRSIFAVHPHHKMISTRIIADRCQVSETYVRHLGNAEGLYPSSHEVKEHSTTHIHHLVDKFCAEWDHRAPRRSVGA